MPIPVICPSCSNNISAPDHVAGRTLRCFKCLNPFTVPNVAPTPAPVAPMAQLAPSFSAAPAMAAVAAPEPAGFSLPPEPAPFAPAPAPEAGPFAAAPAGEADPFAAGPTLEPEPAPPAPAPGDGNPFELQPEANGEPAAVMGSTEELPSTQDIPADGIQMEEAPMELSATDEVEAPLEEMPEEVPEEPVKSTKSRFLAALMAFFLPFSIHRFYLGYTKSAIFQIILYPLVIGILWQFLDGLRLLLRIGFKKDGSGAPF